MKPAKGLAVAAVWAAAATFVITGGNHAQTQTGPVEAPTGYDNESNGLAEEFCADQDRFALATPQSPEIEEDECNFDAAAEEFTGPETTDVGLGPIFNAAGCGECHIANQVLGATSQINEKRAGFWSGSVFRDHPGGSLIQDRAFNPKDQELILDTFNAPGFGTVRTNVIALRSTISVLGDGFVEAVSNDVLRGIANGQPGGQRGLVVNVPVLEAPGQTRVGRFGHKDQQASLLSFSADAYVNEMGITSPMQPTENSSNGNTPEFAPDAPAGIDDEGIDVALFALFMRSTKAPPRGVITTDARAGETVFNQVRCNVCHTPTMTTSPFLTVINGGAFRVPRALASKVIHPFGDFLLHDVGTGDGVVQNGGNASRNTVRTAALWGAGARGRFMHDGLSFSFEDAIRRHGNQAASSRAAFDALGATQKRQVLAFLKSL
jgi:CxxC motif-containing protein (DUF1111 family)